MNEINNTVRTADYKPPAEKRGQMVRCENCRFSMFDEINSSYICFNNECLAYVQKVQPTSGCVLGELDTQSIGDEPV